MWMAMDQRTIINVSMFILALIIAGFSVQWGWSTYSVYRSAQDMVFINRLADDLVRATNIEAEERGMSSLLLARHQHGVSSIREQLAQLRADGDTFWLGAQSSIQQLLLKHKHKGVLGNNLERAGEHYMRFVKARQMIDDMVSGAVEDDQAQITPEEWIESSTTFIGSVKTLRESLLALADMPREIARLNLTLKHWVWLASEHAGRERGILAYYVGAREPVPASILAVLEDYRTVVMQELTELQEMKHHTGMDVRVLDAIFQMEKEFLQEFSAVRRQVYTGVSNGNYPLSGVEWVEKATHAINSILAINMAATEVASHHASQTQKQSVMRFIIILVVVLMAFVVMMVILFKVRQTTNQLFQQKELAQFTLRSIGDAVISTDEQGSIRYLNPIAEKMLGCKTSEVAGKPLRNYFFIINGLTRKPEPNPIDICLQEMRVVGLNDNTILLGRDGKEYAIEDSAAPIRNHQGEAVGAVMVFYESDKMVSKHHLLSYHASHDPLTRLINRREYERRLTELLIHAKNTGEQHALCYIDLDQFKVINDTCGHIAGDKLLRQITYLLQEKVRDRDVLARLGGDEFGLLLEDCGLDDAVHIAENLRKVIKEFRFVWEDSVFDISASFGIVPIDEKSISPVEILSDADAACFAAKDKGRNCIQVFEPGNTELARRHGEMKWVSRITETLKEDRFILYAQTIMPLDRAGPRHVELLIRMLGRDGKVIAPMAFIPAAERYNLMPDVDRWVIQSGIAEIATLLRNNAIENTVFNINLSGGSLGHNDLPQFIQTQLRENNVPPSCICFEITETAAISNFDQAMELMKNLRKIGVQFALDDFGSGLSSFGYLKNMPVDFLKIDGQLIQGIESDPIAYGMVEAIHRVARIMGIKTIAEFVSSNPILDKLYLLEVDYAQGYTIAKPRPFTNGFDPGNGSDVS